MMNLRRKEKSRARNGNNSRIKVIMAIIFLLAAIVLGKLFSLQILKYSLYMGLASSQQQMSSTLEPQRGRIFLEDGPDASNSQLYPIATNKNFAILYAVPKDITDPEKMAENLYEIFRKNKVEKEIDTMLALAEKQKLDSVFSALDNLTDIEANKKKVAILNEYNLLAQDQSYIQMRQIKKDAEIKTRKDGIVSDYMKMFSKKDDVYTQLLTKVDEDVLKSFYQLSYNNNGGNVQAKDLAIKDDYMYLEKDGKKQLIKIDGIGFTMKQFRYYPEANIGANLTGFVGIGDNEQRGHYGLEEFFDTELYGKAGLLKAERDAKGEAIIIDNRTYDKPQDGSDLILTINRSIQFKVCTELNDAVKQHGADSGSVIILDPKSGAILAMCSNPDYDPNYYKEVSDMHDYNNQAIFSQYEPGSIFKAVTMAMGLDLGKINPQTTFNDTGQVKFGKFTIENSDHKAHGVVTMTNVLEQSLNTGAIFVARKAGINSFEKYLKAFGFGEKIGIELEGESKGSLRNLFDDKINNDLNMSTASFGQGISVTPLQMVSAFQAIANNGILMKPYLVKEIVKSNGERSTTAPKQIRRVISDKAAALLGGMLVNVVENGHGKRAAVKGYYVGGKTGTAQVSKKNGRGYQTNTHIGSFAGFAPVDDPRFVMLVRLDNPKDVDWAESSAAPLFGKLAEFMLNYWQVPKERT